MFDSVPVPSYVCGTMSMTACVHVFESVRLCAGMCMWYYVYDSMCACV